VSVALFVTCVADQLYPDTAEATVRVLEAAGVDVEFPEAQTCCGQPAFTAGEPSAAERLARHHIDVFAGYDAVVAPSGSCAAMVRTHYGELLPGEAAAVYDLARRTYELTEYLTGVLQVDDIGARLDASVTMHDACHGLRGLRIADAPRRLLKAAGATVIEMTESDTCCGFGGVFSRQYPEVADKLAGVKLDHARTTNADYLVSTDLACLMHLGNARPSQPNLVHIADLLASGLP
jgi:L-lactate dehydrogenase complex protein LldE